LNQAKKADRLAIRIEIAKIKTEIYGEKQINKLKRRVARLTAAKKKRTYPALELRIVNASSILSAAKAHFALKSV
jgi:hypothetical protein